MVAIRFHCGTKRIIRRRILAVRNLTPVENQANHLDLREHRTRSAVEARDPPGIIASYAKVKVPDALNQGQKVSDHLDIFLAQKKVEMITDVRGAIARMASLSILLTVRVAPYSSRRPTQTSSRRQGRNRLLSLRCGGIRDWEISEHSYCRPTCNPRKCVDR